MTFKRGSRTSSLVQIDHVVALMDSQQKSASNAASWLPPNQAYRCAYVARQVTVKAKYRLWVTAAEKDAIARILTGCPGQRVPAA